MYEPRALVLSIAVFALSGTSEIESTPTEPQARGIQWRTDYAEAKKEMEQRQPPGLDFVYRVDSPPSVKLGKAMNGHSKLVDFLNLHTVPLRVESKSYLAQQLQIDRFPTLVVANSDGKIRRLIIGYHDAADVLDILQRVFSKEK